MCMKIDDLPKEACTSSGNINLLRSVHFSSLVIYK